MNIPSSHHELESELQELYILCSHQLQDISFLEDELRFFDHLLRKRPAAAPSLYENANQMEFDQKIMEQGQHIVNLKTKIPGFLNDLKPYIGNNKKEMDLSFLEKYNAMEDEIRELFLSVKKTKQELFHYAETVLGLQK
jgi:hypothetical protein